MADDLQDPPFPAEEEEQTIPDGGDDNNQGLVMDPIGDPGHRTQDIPLGDEDPEDPLPFAIPDLLKEDEEKEWSLPDELANYFIRYSKTHVLESDLKKELEFFPTPSNVSCVPLLDANLKSTLRKEGSKEAIDVDEDLTTIQRKVQDIMGPLGAAWYSCELVRHKHRPPLTKEEQLTMADQLQKAVLMVANTMQRISWYRRLQSLSSMGNKAVKNVREVLKEEAVKKLLKEDTSNLLIPTEFDTYLKTKETSRKNLVNAFGGASKKKKTEASATVTKPKDQGHNRNRPFSANPHQRGGGTTDSPTRATTARGTTARTLETPSPITAVGEKVSSSTSSSKFKNPAANMSSTPSWLINLKHVIPSLLSFFPVAEINAPLAGRIQKFLPNWKMITHDPKILGIVKGWEIPLLGTPFQGKYPHDVQMNTIEEKAMDQEIENMLAKGAIREAIPKPDQFLSNVFVTPKSDGQFRPIINLKKLNEYVPYHHFKMEGLKDLKHLLQKGDWMCKLDLKDAYFSVPLGTRSRKLVRFRWKEKLYEFLCLAFGLGPAPRIFTKLMKVPISLLRRLGIRLVIYLDDLLIMASSKESLETARDTVMFLFYHLGLTINLKKSVLIPSQTVEFLGIVVDSLTMTFALSPKKIMKLISLCRNALSCPAMTLRELCSLVGKLRSTAPAVSPAPLQVRYLQQVCITAQSNRFHYEQVTSLSREGKTELKWWVENLELLQGNPIHFPPPDLVICSDAAKTGGWGAVCHLGSTGGQWSETEMQYDINVQELIAAELAIKRFTRHHKPSSIHIRIDNTTALSYIIKMGGTKNALMLGIAKRIWHYLILHKIMITAEWIPSHLNTIADWESRNVKDSAEWKLCPKVFQSICLQRGRPDLDLFASRISKQLSRYFSWKADPECLAVDAFKQNWNQGFPYAFPPFCLITRVLRK